MTTTVVETPTQADQTINLFEVGCLINLGIGTWSGTKMCTVADYKSMGLDSNKLPVDMVNLGKKLLVPKAELQIMTKIEQRARSYLSNWSIAFKAVNSHFIPTTMLPSVEAHLEGLQEEFFKCVDSFVSRFGDMKKTIQQSHGEFWDKCLKTHYPSNPALLREKFKFDWFIFEIKETSEDKSRQKMQEQVGNFVEQYVDVMRTETIEFCGLMTARVNGQTYKDEEKPKELTPRSLSMFKKYVDRFKQMNIFGDQEIETMLTEFNSQFMDVGTVPSDLDSAAIKKGVTETLEAIRKKAASQGEEGSKFINSLKRKVVI
ncbi:hypothetical protein LCGC14_1286390 [marine sediment metagenome]|uniref:Uncharacterized protein n=1 Tax=marine sediment metagenome TaxID=412755 RepID=A0A0F9NWP2_9ZZZZ